MKINNHDLSTGRSGVNRLIGGAGMLLLLLACGLADATSLSPDLRGLERIPILVAPSPVIDKALREALPRKDRPIQFAVPVPLALTQAGGLWDEVTPGTARWRARVSSAGAKTLHLHLSGVTLPIGASLWLYDTVADTVQGPYTAANLTDGELWTAVVRGESAVIEARMPSTQRREFTLSLADLQYGFRDWPKAGSLGNAGNCEIDVACTQGDQWRREIRSVGLLTYPVAGGSVLCSGTLINDVAQDKAPFLSTAGHCGIDSSNASQLTVYWEDQSASCGGGTGDLSHNQLGATHKMTDVNSDFTLLRLTSTPAAATKVYYAGWDVTGVAANSGVGIHHPSGDVKKISVYTQQVTKEDVAFNSDTVKTWKVFWAQAVTEEGSSGSGLWNQDHHLIGVLHGGGSDCTHQSDPDFYGRLDVAWNNGLRMQLDPGNTGATVKNGFDSLAATALPDSVSVDENSAAILIDVLSNDAGNQLTIVSVTTPNHGGSAAISSNNISYTPAPGFIGTETFNYIERDLNGATSNASVTVSVVASAPALAVADSFSVSENSSITVLNVLANDVGAGLTLVSVTPPSHGGSATISGNRIFYIPASGFSGIETFDYSEHDSNGNSSAATITVTVRTPPPSGGGGAISPILLLGFMLLRRRRR